MAATTTELKGVSFERLDVEALRKKISEMEAKLGNSDGKLDRLELILILISAGVSKPIAHTYSDDFFRFADRKKTGEVEVEAFISEYVRMSQYRVFHALRTRFGSLENNDGKVTVDALTKELEANMGKDAAAKEVKKMDADASGTVTIVELEKWYNKNKEDLRKTWKFSLEGPPAEKPSLVETAEGGTLLLWISRADGLNFKKKQDIYVRMSTGGKKEKTKVQNTDSKSPEFNEGPFKLFLTKDDKVALEVMDKDTFSSDDVIGGVNVDVKEIAFGATNDRKSDLKAKDGTPCGTLYYKRKFISPEKSKIMEAFFKAVDKDGSKTVDLAELQLWFTTLAKTNEVMEKMDKDNSNAITQDEFYNYMSQWSLEQINLTWDHWQRVAAARKKKKAAGAP